MARKIIFLDIDGVLKTAASDHYWSRSGESSAQKFCPIATSNFCKLLEDLPNHQIILTSSWRLGFTIKQMREIFAANGIPPRKLVGYTEYIKGAPRYVEIQKFIHGEDLGDWVIIDDEAMGPLSDHHIVIDKLVGLTWRQVHETVHYYRRG